MSLVAFDGGTIAADNAMFRDGVRSSFVKLVEVTCSNTDTYLVASVGTVSEILKFRAWLEVGNPTPPPESEHASHIVIPNGSNEWWYYEEGQRWRPELPMAIGARAESAAALALMLAGKTAVDSVDFLLSTRRFDSIGLGLTAYKTDLGKVSPAPDGWHRAD